MKKVLFLMSILFLGFTSCEGPMGPRGPEGPQGPQGPAGSSDIDIVEINVRGIDWERDDVNGYYYCTVEHNLFDDYIYYDGLVSVYIVHRDRNMQQVLPVVIHNIRGSEMWTRTTDYEFGIGGITFYVTFSDFNLDDTPPEGMLFRVYIRYN